MDTGIAIAGFSALGQLTRFNAFQLLMEHEPSGLAAGDIARILRVPQNTMSSHLGVLVRAGLVQSTRRSRSIIYRADPKMAILLADFLQQESRKSGDFAPPITQDTEQ